MDVNTNIKTKNILSDFKINNEVFIPLDNPINIDYSRLNPIRAKWFKKIQHYVEIGILALNGILISSLLYKFSFLEIDTLNQVEFIIFGIEAVLLPFIIYQRKTFDGYLRLTNTTLKIKKRKKHLSFNLKNIQQVFKSYDSSYEDYRIRIILNDGTIIEEKWFNKQDKKTWELGELFLDEINKKIQNQDDN